MLALDTMATSKYVNMNGTNTKIFNLKINCGLTHDQTNNTLDMTKIDGHKWVCLSK